MKLSKFVEQDWISCNQTASSRPEALDIILNSLPDEIETAAREQLLNKEEQMLESTFTVGNGVAFPHARTTELDGIRVAIGLFPEGVQFQEDSPRNVQLVILFLFDEKRSGLYLKVLSAFSKLLEQDVHIDNLARCSSPESLLSYLEATGSRILGSFSLHDLVMPPADVLRTSDTLNDALVSLSEGSEKSIPVLDGEGVLKGEITHQDLIELCLRDYCGSITTGGPDEFAQVFSDFSSLHGHTPVEDVMSSDPFTVDDSCSLFEATRTLVEADRSEAFVTADERLVGCFRLSNWTDKIKRLNI